MSEKIEESGSLEMSESRPPPTVTFLRNGADCAVLHDGKVLFKTTRPTARPIVEGISLSSSVVSSTGRSLRLTVGAGEKGFFVQSG